eukprot:Seg7335.1 transcript_id=Seg7335.1/GoldUCD/mRNA.D3Y31 product="hypothetical protein" protein_id=Seg7335.1/GoldUCD/D3Y31
MLILWILGLWFVQGWMRTDAQAPPTLPSLDPITGTVPAANSATGYLPDTGSNWFDRSHESLEDSVGKPFIPSSNSPLSIYNKPEVLDPFYAKTNVFHHHHHFLIPVRTKTKHIHHHHQHHHHHPIDIHHHHHDPQHVYPGNLVGVVHHGNNHYGNNHHGYGHTSNNLYTTNHHGYGHTGNNLYSTNHHGYGHNGNNLYSTNHHGNGHHSHGHQGYSNSEIDSVDFDEILHELNHELSGGQTGHGANGGQGSRKHHTQTQHGGKHHSKFASFTIDIPENHVATPVAQTEHHDAHPAMTVTHPEAPSPHPYVIDPSIADSIAVPQIHGINTQIGDNNKPVTSNFGTASSQPGYGGLPNGGLNTQGPQGPQGSQGAGYGSLSGYMNTANNAFGNQFGNAFTGSPNAYGASQNMYGGTQNMYGGTQVPYSGLQGVQSYAQAGNALGSNNLLPTEVGLGQPNQAFANLNTLPGTQGGITAQNTAGSEHGLSGTDVTHSTLLPTAQEAHQETHHIETATAITTDPSHHATTIASTSSSNAQTKSEPAAQPYDNAMGGYGHPNAVSTEHVEAESQNEIVQQGAVHVNAENEEHSVTAPALHHFMTDPNGNELHEIHDVPNADMEEHHMTSIVDHGAAESNVMSDNFMDDGAEHIMESDLNHIDGGNGANGNAAIGQGTNDISGIEHGDHAVIEHGGTSVVEQAITDHNGDHAVIEHGGTSVIEQAITDHTGIEHGINDHAAIDNRFLDHGEAVHEFTDHVTSDHGLDHGVSDHAGIEHEISVAEHDHGMIDHDIVDEHGISNHPISLHTEEVHDPGLHVNFHAMDDGSEFHDGVEGLDHHPVTHIVHEEHGGIAHGSNEIGINDGETIVDHHHHPVIHEHVHEVHDVPHHDLHESFHDDHRDYHDGGIAPELTEGNIHSNVVPEYHGENPMTDLHGGIGHQGLHEGFHEGLHDSRHDIGHGEVSEFGHDIEHAHGMKDELAQEAHDVHDIQDEFASDLHGHEHAAGIAPELHHSNTQSNVVPEYHGDHSVTYSEHDTHNTHGVHGFDEHGGEFMINPDAGAHGLENEEFHTIKDEIHPGDNSDENNVHLDAKDVELIKKARQNEHVDPPFLTHTDPHGDGFGEGVVAGPDLNVGNDAISQPGSPVADHFPQEIPNVAPFVGNHPATQVHGNMIAPDYGSKRESFTQPKKPGYVSTGSPKTPEETAPKSNARTTGTAKLGEQVSMSMMKPKIMKFIRGSRREGLSHSVKGKNGSQAEQNKEQLTYETIPNEPRISFETVPNEERQNEPSNANTTVALGESKEQGNNSTSIENVEKENERAEKGGESAKKEEGVKDETKDMTGESEGKITLDSPQLNTETGKGRSENSTDKTESETGNKDAFNHDSSTSANATNTNDTTDKVASLGSGVLDSDNNDVTGQSGKSKTSEIKGSETKEVSADEFVSEFATNDRSEGGESRTEEGKEDGKDKEDKSSGETDKEMKKIEEDKAKKVGEIKGKKTKDDKQSMKTRKETKKIEGDKGSETKKVKENKERKDKEDKEKGKVSEDNRGTKQEIKSVEEKKEKETKNFKTEKGSKDVKKENEKNQGDNEKDKGKGKEGSKVKQKKAGKVKEQSSEIRTADETVSQDSKEEMGGKSENALKGKDEAKEKESNKIEEMKKETGKDKKVEETKNKTVEMQKYYDSKQEKKDASSKNEEINKKKKDLNKSKAKGKKGGEGNKEKDKEDAGVQEHTGDLGTAKATGGDAESNPGGAKRVDKPKENESRLDSKSDGEKLKNDKKLEKVAKENTSEDNKITDEKKVEETVKESDKKLAKDKSGESRNNTVNTGESQDKQHGQGETNNVNNNNGTKTNGYGLNGGPGDVNSYADNQSENKTQENGQGNEEIEKVDDAGGDIAPEEAKANSEGSSGENKGTEVVGVDGEGSGFERVEPQESDQSSESKAAEKGEEMKNEKNTANVAVDKEEWKSKDNAEKQETELKQSDGENTEQSKETEENKSSEASQASGSAAGETKQEDGGVKQVEEDKKPDEGETKQAEGEPKPAQGEVKQAEGEMKQANSETKPVEAESKTAEGDAKQADGESKPAEGGSKPAEGATKQAEESQSEKPKETSQQETVHIKVQDTVSEVQANQGPTQSPSQMYMTGDNNSHQDGGLVTTPTESVATQGESNEITTDKGNHELDGIAKSEGNYLEGSSSGSKDGKTKSDAYGPGNTEAYVEAELDGESDKTDSETDPAQGAQWKFHGNDTVEVDGAETTTVQTRDDEPTKPDSEEKELFGGVTTQEPDVELSPTTKVSYATLDDVTDESGTRIGEEMVALKGAALNMDTAPKESQSSISKRNKQPRKGKNVLGKKKNYRKWKEKVNKKTKQNKTKNMSNIVKRMRLSRRNFLPHFDNEIAKSRRRVLSLRSLYRRFIEEMR